MVTNPGVLAVHHRSENAFSGFLARLFSPANSRSGFRGLAGQFDRSPGQLTAGASTLLPSPSPPVAPVIDQPGICPSISCPGGNQTPVPPDDYVGAVLLESAHAEVLPGCAIVARGLIGRQRYCPHTVQFANPIWRQLLSDPGAHRGSLNSAVGPKGFFPSLPGL